MIRHANRAGNCAKPRHVSPAVALLCLLGRCILALRYRVLVQGDATVRRRGTEGILFLPNHPALIDPVILITYLYRRFGVRPVAVEDQIKAPLVRAFATLFGVVPIPTLSEVDEQSAKAVQQSIDRCIEALRRGDNVLLYPAGRLMHRRCETLGGASGAYRIISEVPNVRVVLVQIGRAHV